MPYEIHAWLDRSGAGAFDDQAATKDEALKKARIIRNQGYQVRIFGPDGKPLSQNQD